jgi:hypothetical protein
MKDNILHSEIEVRLTVIVKKHTGVKCPRCWHRHHLYDNYDNLCDRCCHVIIEDFPHHESAPFIVEAYEKQAVKHNIKSGWREKREKAIAKLALN